MSHRSTSSNSTSAAPAPRLSTPPISSQKTRQLSHLQAQLAQLTANMSDLESLVRMTAQQAGDVRGLGGYVGGMFMAGSKVLGEESVKEGAGSPGVAGAGSGSGSGSGSGGARRESDA